VDSESDLFSVNSIFHVAENKSILAWNCCIKSENSFLVLATRKDYLIVWIQDEEINKAVFFFGAWLCVNKVCASHVDRVGRCVLME